MEQWLIYKLEALKKQAKDGGIKSGKTKRGISSLHKFIKTKEQADKLMKSLKNN